MVPGQAIFSRFQLDALVVHSLGCGLRLLPLCRESHPIYSKLLSSIICLPTDWFTKKAAAVIKTHGCWPQDCERMPATHRHRVQSRQSGAASTTNRIFKPSRRCSYGPERFFVEMAEHLLASLYQVGSLNIRHSTLIEVCQTRRSLALFQQSVSEIQGSLDFPKPRTTDAISEMSEN
jgi:hypothetical protein